MALPSFPLKTNFYQILGRHSSAHQLNDDDIMTAVQFERRGDYLAIGDQGGRVVIFQKDDKKIEPFYDRKSMEELDSVPAQHPEFRFMTQFKSHEREFDIFKNVEATERIKKVSWGVAKNGLLLLLSANDKTIKLWTIKERKTEASEQVVSHGRNRFLSSENILTSQQTLNSSDGNHLGWTKNLSRENPQFLGIDDDEKIAGTGKNSLAKCQKVYAQDHIFNINSISNSSDATTFISADDFRINLWNLEVSERSFNLIDMKTSNMENACEKISSAEFHPVHCNLLAYASSHGAIRISDLRQPVRCESARVIRDRRHSGLNLPFEDLAACISDVKFLADDTVGQQLLSRDYINMKLWDMRMDFSPVATFKIHEHLRVRLAELYLKDHIYDKFDCCFSGDGLSFATGSYSNRLKLFSLRNASVEDIKLDVLGNIESFRMPVLPNGTVRRSPICNVKQGIDQGGGIDDGFSSKLLNVAWHPTSNIVACAVQSCLMLYHT